ncbi:MAG: hypothetical protein HXS52_00045 [Theionarchaea archaeon]|nr:hypothetical protein [Theionarchaea archaeon]MBU7036292.1 hypothetical protein [Theionarchaea archaeon]
MSSEVKERVVSSFFGTRYFTLLDLEIKQRISVNGLCSRQDLGNNLCQKGYAEEDVEKELIRQGHCSTIRYLPDKDTYVSLDMGKALWMDICHRINEQDQLLAGSLYYRKGFITLDVYRTDFQSPQLRKAAISSGLRRAPVMRRTGRFQPGDASRCLKGLLHVLPEAACGPGDYAGVLQKTGEKIGRKPPKTPWVWLAVHPVIEVDLPPWRKTVLRALFSLTNGPATWRGTPVSLYELTGYLDASLSDIEEPLTYFLGTGIIQTAENDYTPTEEGYALLSGIFRPRHRVTFAVTRCGRLLYRLEVSSPSFLCPEVLDFLVEAGGCPHESRGTPVVFSPGRRSHVMEVMEGLMKTIAAIEDR